MNVEVYSRTESSNDCWETPDYFFQLLNKKYKFTLDPCSSHENHKCEKYYTIEDNGLLQDWTGERVFVNPPFANIDVWMEKCYKASLKEKTLVVAIIPSRTDTKYWHNFCMKAYAIAFCKGRVNFELPCAICGKRISKTIPYKENGSKVRICQDCYFKHTGKEKRGNSSTFPLAVIVFFKHNYKYPKMRPFYHKEKDLKRFKEWKLE